MIQRSIFHAGGTGAVPWNVVELGKSRERPHIEEYKRGSEEGRAKQAGSVAVLILGIKNNSNTDKSDRLLLVPTAVSQLERVETSRTPDCSVVSGHLQANY